MHLSRLACPRLTNLLGETETAAIALLPKENANEPSQAVRHLRRYEEEVALCFDFLSFAICPFEENYAVGPLRIQIRDGSLFYLGKQWRLLVGALALPLQLHKKT